MQQPERLPLFTLIKQRSEVFYKEACQYCKLHEKLAKVRQQLNFDMRCKRSNVLPQTLRFTPPIKTPQGWSTARRMGRAYLNCYIQDAHYRLLRDIR